MARDDLSFSIPRTAFLDTEGRPLGELPAVAGDMAQLRTLYAAMVRTRAFDSQAVDLQRTGRLGTYASSLGQEAVAVGVASAMRQEDVLLPSFREHGAQLWRGVSMVELLQFWGGDERGSDYRGPREDFPVCIPVASQFPHAAGVATAFALRAAPRVAVAVGGDGATSKGDFYEALNVLGVWRLPAVFVINDNQWAISVRREAQSAAETLAQKAVAAGLPGEQVDGNDVIAVHDAVARALARARAGDGASLIECMTYRLADHTTSDDASRYRDEAEVEAHWPEEPLRRLRCFMEAGGGWSAADEAALVQSCADEVADAVQAYLAIPADRAVSMFDHLYEVLPADLGEQRRTVAAEAGDA